MQQRIRAMRGLLPAACVVAWIAWTAPIKAADNDPPASARLKFDSDSGEWVDLPAPVPGTSAGDLAAARVSFSERRFKTTKTALKKWFERYDGSDLAADALLLSARTEKALKNYNNANVIAHRILDQYPGTGTASDAIVELFNVAEAFLGGARRKVWGIPLLSGEDLALDILDEIAVEYPDSTDAELAIKTKADYFYRKGDYLLAEYEYGRLLEQFPAGRYGRYAMRQSANSALQGFGGVLFDSAPLIEAEERFRQYNERFPELAAEEGVGLILRGIHEKRGLKEFEIGRYYERTRHERAAAFYYRSTVEHFPGTVAATKAADALEAMAIEERPNEPRSDDSPPMTDDPTPPAPSSDLEP